MNNTLKALGELERDKFKETTKEFERVVNKTMKRIEKDQEFEATKRAMKEPRNDDNGIKAQKELV